MQAGGQIYRKIQKTENSFLLNGKIKIFVEEKKKQTNQKNPKTQNSQGSIEEEIVRENVPSRVPEQFSKLVETVMKRGVGTRKGKLKQGTAQSSQNSFRRVCF